MGRLLERKHVAMVMPPAADRFDTSQVSAPVNLANYSNAEFIVAIGAGATGTATLTVEACDDNSGTNPVAIPFELAVQSPGANTNDTWGAYADQTSAGYTTVAGDYKLLSIRVRARQLPSGKQWCRVKATEVVNSPVAAAIIAILGCPRYSQVPNRKALA